MRRAMQISALMAFTLPLAGAGRCEEAKQQAAPRKPLVLFVGDSITAGKPTGRPDYKPDDSLAASAGLKEGAYGYFEALVEATKGQDIPFSLKKLGNGGQAITGWIGTTCRQVLEKRHSIAKELPAILVVQDYIAVKDEEGKKALEEALRAMAGQARKAGVKLIWSTVATDPRGSSGLKASDEDVRATNELILRVAKEQNVPVVRLDMAWARYEEFARDREPARDWILTMRGKIADGVHPGTVGALFQALVFARELGIPAEKFDEKAQTLGVKPGQAAEIKKLVYSWTEPTAVSSAAAKDPEHIMKTP